MNVYEIITDRIVALLEGGVVPWRKPWTDGHHQPRNLVSKKLYRGVNVLVLSHSGHSSPWWLTFKQAKELGGYVRRGQKGSPVIFWKWLDRKDETDNGEQETRRVPLLRYYTVFNVEQCGGLSDKVPEVEAVKVFEPIAAAEGLVRWMPSPPRIQHVEPRAYYRPADDLVNLPRRELFASPEDFYCTLFHELSHATGHPTRLNRQGVTELAAFGSHTYTREELVAECGAAFLAAEVGIESTLESSAAYIGGWLKKIKEDKRLVVLAAAQAQKAADYVLGRLKEDAEEVSA